MEILGTMQFQRIELGFWGILDGQGRKFRPVKTPPELQQNGLRVRLQVKSISQPFSFFMWGTPVEIVSYRTE